MFRRLPLLVAGLTATAIPCFAQYSVSGPGGLVPATGTGGGGNALNTLPTSSAAFPLTTPIPANAANITSVTISGLFHTWSGDIQAVLWNPGHTTGYNLIVRLGVASPPGTGVGFAGDYGMPSAVPPVGFNYTIVKAGDPSINQAWPIVSQTVAAGTYAQQYGLTYGAGWTSGSANVFNTDLASIPVVPGLWSLELYDGAGGDSGAISGWTLTGDTVVSPVLPASYCFGDGTGTACPCGNSGAAGNGCASSTNANGANLLGSGIPSVTADTLVLTTTGAPNVSPCLYFQGTAGGAGTLLNDGLMCAGGNVIRLGTKISAGGVSSYPSGSPAIHVKGACAPGNVRFYQAIYRDAAPYCTVDSANQTNGVSVTWGS